MMMKYVFQDQLQLSQINRHFRFFLNEVYIFLLKKKNPKRLKNGYFLICTSTIVYFSRKYSNIFPIINQVAPKNI